jgi:flagellar L-ring protein precursor FlgH
MAVPRLLTLSVLLLAMPLSVRARKRNPPPPSAIDRMIEEAQNREPGLEAAAPGSIFVGSSFLSDAYRDLRASRVDDIVTVLVSDRASALSTGTTATQRQSASSGGIKTIFGKSVGPLGDIATLSGNQDLKSQGSTGRESTLTTTLTARVSQVLPNGSLVIEAEKDIAMNSERQQVKIRGVIRRFDISTANTVRSDRIANLEVTVNGKGVVGDAIRRPNVFYRILNGILPF